MHKNENKMQYNNINLGGLTMVYELSIIQERMQVSTLDFAKSKFFIVISKMSIKI